MKRLSVSHRERLQSCFVLLDRNERLSYSPGESGDTSVVKKGYRRDCWGCLEPSTECQLKTRRHQRRSASIVSTRKGSSVSYTESRP